MTVLAHRLSSRVDVQRAVQTPDSVTGGFVRSYETIATVWGGVRPLSHNAFVRGVQTEFAVTHEVLVRHAAVNGLGCSFSTSFATAFDQAAGLRPLKSEYFLFVNKGSLYHGLRLRVRRIMDPEERGEYLSLLCEEMHVE